MKRFDTASELVEANAQMKHDANLRNGGVFIEKDGKSIPYSDLELERKWASTSMVFVHADYAKIDGIPESVSCYYIKGVGYTPDLRGGARLKTEGDALQNSLRSGR